MQPGVVTICCGDQTDHIATQTVMWAAGVVASPLGAVVARAAGIAPDHFGRVPVNPDLTLPGHPEVFVIGDLACFTHDGGQPLPGVAPVAMQQGAYVAKTIQARFNGQTLPPFHYHDKGSMATIGRGRAVADIGWLKLWGYPAWWAWLFIHLLFLIAFDNRLMVLFQWAWNYLTRNRSARLITNTGPAGWQTGAANGPGRNQ
jgi:NADH dehydrogenase